MVPRLSWAGVKQRKPWSQRWRLETAASLGHFSEFFNLDTDFVIYTIFENGTCLLSKILIKQTASRIFTNNAVYVLTNDCLDFH